MSALTSLVLDEALSQCAAWRADGKELTVSVNISASDLLDPGFPELVERLLAHHALPAEALVLEMTETTAIADFERSQLAIQKLHDLGLIVSVDDFGAGFTSLAYLGSLAVGELKLDRSFITRLAEAEHGRDVALVRATVELAHALGPSRRRRGRRGQPLPRTAHRPALRSRAGVRDLEAQAGRRARAGAPVAPGRRPPPGSLSRTTIIRACTRTRLRSSPASSSPPVAPSGSGPRSNCCPTATRRCSTTSSPPRAPATSTSCCA